MTLRLKTTTYVATTSGVTGEADISIKIPGTFGLSIDGVTAAANPLDGYAPPSAQGRFLDKAELFADDPVDGDMVKQLRIEDTDGVIPTELRSSIPDYPILLKFYDSITETTEIKNGFYLNAYSTTIVAPLSRIPTFIPAGLYIKGLFKCSTITTKKLRVNLWWGDNSAL